ncbi:MAG: hypothetical protein HFF97_09965 [Oscillibacter sp.]|jgi:hypothetical protein|nr:hypothetical protein [Oscillibacter sp.]
MEGRKTGGGRIVLPKRKREDSQVWRVWVDTRRRVVSFHEAPGYQLLEFHSYELFLSCIDSYTAQRYRYQ